MHSDELFAEVARAMGLASQAQIDECRAAADAADARRPIGVRLMRRGYLAYPDFVRLLDECRARRARAGTSGRERVDVPLFGRLAVELGAVTAEELDEALRLQGERIEAGIVPVPRIGEILMDQRNVRSMHVQRILAMQGITHMGCVKCRAQYNVVDAQPERVYTCRSCRGTLVRVLPEPGPRAVQTVHGEHVRVRPGAPDEVAHAALNPENHFGEFILVELIPRPGLGTAHRAWDGAHSRWTLLHHFPGIGADAPEATGARNVARRAGALPSGAFPPLTGDGACDGVPWISLEWRDAPTLARLRPGLQRSAEVVSVAAEAVAELHDAGLLHANLTPFAIRVDLEGRVTIAEAGLAPPIEVADAAAAGCRASIRGTPSYLAPELMRAGGPVDPSRASDIYSLGAVLYNLITSKPPAEGRTIRELAGLVCRGAIIPPRRRNPELPKDLERICLRAMTPKPEQRYATAKDLARDLRRFADGRSLLAR